MKLELNDELIAALSGITDWGDHFTEDEYNAWNDLISEKIKNGEIDLLKKVLGISFKTYVSDSVPQIMEQIGLSDKEYIKRTAYMLYREDTFKEFGNEAVTEPLNYISVNGKDIAHAYFETL